MQVAQERRTQPRARLSSPVVAFVGDLRIDCTAVDISAVGIGMRGPRLAAPGQFLRINFCLQTDSGVPRWFDADGVVARVVLRGDAYEFGVQFLVVEDRVAKEIHGYVTGAQRAAQLQAQATEWPNDGLPDATHPPKRTGEFGPAGANSDKRRTAEYGTSTQAAVGETPGSSAPAKSSASSSSSPSTGNGTGESKRSTNETKRSTNETKRSTDEQRRAATMPGSTTARTNPPDPARSARHTPREAPLAPLEDLVPQSELKALYRAALSEVNGKDPKKKK
ncbi:MAG TPA: PilZ domain-containing protein [Nannocystaceae bacterium]|nr:PilZ domain-containing protein [Nannocystaceae bacterium]